MEFVEFIQTPKIDGVTLYRPFQPPVEGTLCVTGHHLILSSRKDNKEELWLLHKNVDSVEKKLTGSTGILTLRCKDFPTLQLEIPLAEECINIGNSIEALSNIDDVTLSYPFFYRAMFTILEDGWQAFMAESEFSRLIGHSEEWRLSYINKNFEGYKHIQLVFSKVVDQVLFKLDEDAPWVCSSYPQAVVVPKSIDDETLVRVAAFRQHGRFPVLSYYHKGNGMGILRSSQPLTGPNGRRCKEDERLLNATLGIGKRGYILDTRSVSLSKLATAKGGGVEPEVHYPQWRKINQAIERYQVLHESLIKMVEACYDTSTSMDKWLSKLESSNWLTHVKDVLTCACVAAQCIDKEGASVLVHGSEGMDSTLQVTSLAQIILDHDCRTVRGFEALIEREWLQAGHPFASRCAKSAFAISKHRQEAPVFLLFIDCVWQIWRQFPCSFEYNEDFLITVFQHAYASQFGTFLCNSEMERKRCKLGQKTVSLWSYINRPEILQQYLNPLYEPNAAVLWPSVAPQSLTLWSGLYQRWQKHQIAQDQLWQDIMHIKEHDKEVKARVLKLRKQLQSLEEEAVQNNLITGEVQDGKA